MLVAFDLLYLNGYDLRKMPLFERKAQLKKIIDGTDVQFSESFEVDGREMYQHACKVGLEGVVSKIRDSPYRSGRSKDWVKKAYAQRGRRKGNDLVYGGKVDYGFDAASAKDLQARLKPLIRKTPTLRQKDRASRCLGGAVVAG